MTAAAPRPLIDELLPGFDEHERHARLVPASAADVWAALRRADLLGSPVVRALLLLRGLGGSRREALTLDRLLGRGFVLLGERPGRELALGLVGRFWTPSGPAVHGDPHPVPRSTEPPSLPALLAAGPPVQRPHPHRNAAGGGARGYASSSGTFDFA